jgi:hypothetical protein
MDIQVGIGNELRREKPLHKKIRGDKDNGSNH